MQISASRGAEISELTGILVDSALEDAGMTAKSMEVQGSSLLVRFDEVDTQLKAKDVIKASLGNAYTVALNLAPATPEWLRSLGAKPMFLGLDLRGGVHFLMEVDMPAAIKKAEERYVSDLRTLVRENKIRYKTIGRQGSGGLLLRFRDLQQLQDGNTLIVKEYPELNVEELDDVDGEAQLRVTIKEESVLETQSLALQQNMTTLRKRVNELGVAEPVIQQQGVNRVVVQLPGVQDTAQAKEILGATATLEFRMVDEEHPVEDAVDGRIPAGSNLYS